MSDKKKIPVVTPKSEFSEKLLFQNAGDLFQKLLLETITTPSLLTLIKSNLRNFQGFQKSLESQLQKCAAVKEFRKIFQQLEGRELLQELFSEDVTLTFSLVGAMRKSTASTQENVKSYEESLMLMLIVINHYYGFKSKGKIKFNILVNSLFLQGKERLSQFEEKLLQTVQTESEVDFPVKMKQCFGDIKEALFFPQGIDLNDELLLLHLKCLLAVRKIFLEYLLNFFSVLQILDTRTGNEKVGIICIEKAEVLFSPVLSEVQEEIEQFRSKHQKKLESSYDPGETKEEDKLKLWFDYLDIYFEHDPEIRKLKLYVSTLAESEIAIWATLMNIRFRDFPAILKEIEAIKQAPKDYRGIHSFAVLAYQKVPAIQRKIKEGMKIIESLQGRFHGFVKSIKSKKGMDYVPNYSDVYNLFHTLQEGREGSSFFRDDDTTFVKRSDNQSAEMRLFAKLSTRKQETFLALVLTSVKNPSYVRSIAWQLFHHKDTSLFTKFENYLSYQKSKSEDVEQIIAAFSLVTQQAESELDAQMDAKQKEIQEEKKNQEFEKKIDQLKRAKGQFAGVILASEDHAKTTEAKKKREELDKYYEARGIKRLTSDKLEDYLKERRAKFQKYLEEMREKRKIMNKKQLKVSESTESFANAELNIMEKLSPKGSDESGGAIVSLDSESVDKFEKETIEALEGYNESCPAHGEYKSEYFENRKNEIRGMLHNLREQVQDQAIEGDVAVRIMDSVHDLMNSVEQTMQNLAKDLPEDAHQKLKVILESEEKLFNEMMEKEFEIEVRGNKTLYKLKAFIILPIFSKQKILAVEALQFTKGNELSSAELKSLENFLYFRSALAGMEPMDIQAKDGGIQMVKLANYLWYESLLYETISFKFGKEIEKITLQDLYNLPLKPEGEKKFAQHTALVEKILTETQDSSDEDFKERIIRDIKNKNFEINLSSRYRQHNQTFDLFPGGNFEEKVFIKVIEWYRVRKEDQKINYYASKSR
ncbi:MAG: hypothetical protein HQM13_00135 [SAR324 cluster bacterium]|nr:hypothetical protein [SAR324 cluster bacterium]